MSDFGFLFKNPSERLDLELKRWIDPKSDEGVQKIVRGCFALRNNNGGLFVVGICDDGSVDTANAPKDPRIEFHQDEIQRLIGKYASESFEVLVEFVEEENSLCVVLRVPAGIRNPVVCKADLPGKLRVGDVYVRTLQSNLTVSSSVAGWKDWPVVIQHCFDNREADIGAFVRRHLSGIDNDAVSRIFSVLGRPSSPGAQELSTQLLNDGYRRFEEVVRESHFELDQRLGIHEVAIVVEGAQEDVPPLTEETLWKLEASMPRHTGLPPWTSFLSSLNDSIRPYVLNKGWETVLKDVHDRPHLDFWRLEPTGRMYIARGLEDDLSVSRRAPPPYTSLDFVLVIYRTSEVISVAIAIAQAFGFDAAKSTLAISFRWRHLKGRHLVSWADPSRTFHSRDAARQDDVVTELSIPLDTPRDALTPHVEKVVRPVFELFGGMPFHSSVIDGVVKKAMSRQ